MTKSTREEIRIGDLAIRFLVEGEASGGSVAVGGTRAVHAVRAAVRLPAIGTTRVPAMALQRYRMRTPSTGRETIVEADPDRVYRDRETGEELEVVAKVVPLAPSRSRLPWAVETLRFCNWCDQLAQRDLNDCPTCGRRMAPIAS